MEKEQPSFYAIIPANVRYDKSICANSKLLYGEITALTNAKGYCWASNSYFAELYQVSNKTVSRWFTELENAGYITRELIYKEGTREIDKRYTRINAYPMDKKVEGYGQKNGYPMDKIAEDNNTLINNTINIKDIRQKFKTSDMDNAKLLFKMMQDNNPNVKEPNFEKWANEFRLMRERDGRTDNHIKYMINWCQKDSFWYKNILSPDKLRKQWDRLTLAAKEDYEKKQKPSYQATAGSFRFSEMAQEQQQNMKWGAGQIE